MFSTFILSLRLIQEGQLSGGGGGGGALLWMIILHLHDNQMEPMMIMSDQEKCG